MAADNNSQGWSIREAIGGLRANVQRLIEGQQRTEERLDRGLKETNRRIDRVTYAIIAFGSGKTCAISRPTYAPPTARPLPPGGYAFPATGVGRFRGRRPPLLRE